MNRPIRARRRRVFPWLATAVVVVAAGCLNASRVLGTQPETILATPIALVGYSTAFGPRGFDEMRTSRPERARLPSPGQIEDYQTNRHKSVVELQQFREVTSLTVDSFEGASAVASLIDLSPQIGTWYLLRLTTSDGRTSNFHLENPSGARLRLDAAFRLGIVIEREGSESNEKTLCELVVRRHGLRTRRALAIRGSPTRRCAAGSVLAQSGGGQRTPKERVVDLLRDHVWKGEEITVLVRDLFYRDAYLATSGLVTAP